MYFLSLIKEYEYDVSKFLNIYNLSPLKHTHTHTHIYICLLYTSDAADE